jgi:hypothetical protein
MWPYFVLYCSASCVMIVGMWGKNERCKKPRLGDFRASLPTLSSVATQCNREQLQNICNLNLKTLQPRNLLFTFPSSRGFVVNVHPDGLVVWENVLMSAASHVVFAVIIPRKRRCTQATHPCSARSCVLIHFISSILSYRSFESLSESWTHGQLSTIAFASLLSSEFSTL